MHLKWRAKDDAGHFRVGTQDRSFEGDFQGRCFRRVADQRVAEHPRRAIGRAADGDAQAARARPAAIDHSSRPPGIDDKQAHANAFNTMPRRTKASRSAWTNATAWGLSPWTHKLRMPCSWINRSACRTASSGSVTNASDCERGTSEPSGK